VWLADEMRSSFPRNALVAFSTQTCGPAVRSSLIRDDGGRAVAKDGDDGRTWQAIAIAGAVLAALLVIAGFSGGLIMAGLMSLLLGAGAALAGQARWAFIVSRKTAGLVAAAGLAALPWWVGPRPLLPPPVRHLPSRRSKSSSPSRNRRSMTRQRSWLQRRAWPPLRRRRCPKALGRPGSWRTRQRTRRWPTRHRPRLLPRWRLSR
jgi:hypothetical protein